MAQLGEDAAALQQPRHFGRTFPAGPLPMHPMSWRADGSSAGGLAGASESTVSLLLPSSDRLPLAIRHPICNHEATHRPRGGPRGTRDAHAI
jgi:hypothetical protein